MFNLIIPVSLSLSVYVFINSKIIYYLFLFCLNYDGVEFLMFLFFNTGITSRLWWRSSWRRWVTGWKSPSPSFATSRLILNSKIPEIWSHAPFIVFKISKKRLGSMCSNLAISCFALCNIPTSQYFWNINLHTNAYIKIAFFTSFSLYF